MKIVLSRVDERLAHGQVIASWVKQLNVKKILIVDDQLANDSFMSEVLKMATPTGIDLIVLTVSDAYKQLQESTYSEKVLLLFKTISSAYNLYKLGYDLKKLNIGNIGSMPGRKGITKKVFMSPTEIDEAKELSESGVYVYLQMLYSDSEVDIKNILK